MATLPFVEEIKRKFNLSEEEIRDLKEQFSQVSSMYHLCRFLLKDEILKGLLLYYISTINPIVEEENIDRVNYESYILEEFIIPFLEKLNIDLEKEGKTIYSFIASLLYFFAEGIRFKDVNKEFEPQERIALEVGKKYLVYPFSWALFDLMDSLDKKEHKNLFGLSVGELLGILEEPGLFSKEENYVICIFRSVFNKKYTFVSLLPCIICEYNDENRERESS